MCQDMMEVSYFCMVERDPDGLGITFTLGGAVACSGGEGISGRIGLTDMG